MAPVSGEPRGARSGRHSGVLLLKNVLFTALVPGTVAILVPNRILAWSGRPDPGGFGLLRWSGLAPILLGGALYLWSVSGFAREGEGTPAAIDPPKRLVVEGPYRFARNPMYIAVLAVILGESILFASPWLLAYGLFVLAAFTSFVLLYEEPTLRRRFGSSYESYCASVPRWFLSRRDRRTGEGT